MLEREPRHTDLSNQNDSEDHDEHERHDESELDDGLPSLALHRPSERTNWPHQALKPSIARRQNGTQRAR